MSAFGTAAYATNEAARSALLNKSIALGYTLSTAIDYEHHVYAILASMLNDAFPSVAYADNATLTFGTGNDVVMKWDATNLTVKPVADDTGAIIVGDGTTDMDFKVFLGDTLNYALFDVGLQRVKLVFSTVGGDSAQGLDIDVAPLAGAGYRQGGINCSVARASGQSVTWDGNPDCAIKALARNSAANASEEGAVRGIDVQGRNSGTNASWVEGASFNCRTDSGKTTGIMCGVRIRVEDYGTISTEAIGIDVNLSVEGASPITTGILVRSTDLSAMAAVKEVFRISHTSANGFTNLFNFAGATGDTAATGSLKGSGEADILCDARITCVFNGTPYYLPLYNTVV